MDRSHANWAVASTLILVACLGGGCGTDDENQAVTCPADTFRLVGTIDGMSIDVTQSPNYSGFDQLGSGEFFSIFGPGNSMTATYTDLQVKWPLLVPDGGTEAATATVKIPTSPFPTDVFCAGPGTTVHMSSDVDGQITFHLASLSSGDGCAMARTGTLEACSRGAAR